MGVILSKVLCDVLVYQGDVVDPVQATCYTSLVCDHRDGDICVIESGDRFRRPVDEFDAINRADISVVHDDRAVTIEKDPRPQTRVPCRMVRIGHATFTVSPHIAGYLISLSQGARI